MNSCDILLRTALSKKKSHGNCRLCNSECIVITVMKVDAGMADLDVTATSPSGQEIPLQVTPLNDGAEMIEFSPSVPGTYMINVTYGNL